MQHVLIVGGSSGLGLELASILSATDHVIVTGRRDPKKEQLDFRHLDLDQFADDPDHFVDGLPTIDIFIYAAGFYQEGTVSELDDVWLFQT